MNRKGLLICLAVFTISLGLALFVGCAKQEAQSNAHQHLENGDNPEKVASNEIMCAEHGMPERLCTKCKPHLVAEFKEKGDWCSGHGVPESLCPICNPARSGNEATEGVMCVEHGMPEEFCTKCKPHLITQFKEKGDWCGEHGVPESLCSICNPALIGTVRFPPENADIAGIETEAVKPGKLERVLEVPGKIQLDQQKVAVVSATVDGRIERIHSVLYDKVKKGKALVSIFSTKSIAIQEEFIQAYRRMNRTKQRGNNDATEVARSIYESARARLIASRFTPGAISQLEQTGTVQQHLILHTPISGTVVKSNVASGEYVDIGEPLFKVANISSVWAIADVREKDIALIRKGMSADIRVGAYKDQTFRGTVTAIGDILDEHTRTIKVRLNVPNRHGKLKPMMYVTVSISTGKAFGVAVPSGSILLDKDKRYIFAKTAPGTYNRKDVSILYETDSLTQIQADLREDDQIVVTGAYLLKSEMLKASMGEGCAD